MKPIETEIMKKFLAKSILVGDYKFDVRLPYTPDGNFEQLQDYEQKMLIAVHQKRIDAVCETPNIIYIIEVKEKLNHTAVGELETYEIKFFEMTKTHKAIKKVVVCELTDKDLIPVCKKHNITVFVV